MKKFYVCFDFASDKKKIFVNKKEAKQFAKINGYGVAKVRYLNGIRLFATM